MDNEISIKDIFYPIWLRRGEVFLVTIFLLIFLPSSLSFIKKTANVDSPVYWHQDVKFNSLLPESIRELFISQPFIEEAYKSNGLNHTSDKEILLLKNSTRYELMRENLIDNSDQLIINLLDTSASKLGSNVSNNFSFWEKYLNLDSDYFQLLIIDDSLSSIEAGKVVNSLMANYNSYIKENHAIHAYSDVITELGFDSSQQNLVYLSDRLDTIKSTINEYLIDFNGVNLDARELLFKTDLLLANIDFMDKSLIDDTMSLYNYQIEQHEELKESFEKMYDKFYGDEINETINPVDTQLTVDAISQLIDLGKDIHELDNRTKLIEAMYNITLDIQDLETQIFELQRIQKINYSTDKSLKDMNLLISNETQNITEQLNSYIKKVNETKQIPSVLYVGNTYKQVVHRINYNTLTISIVILAIILLLYVVSIHVRFNRSN